jgi:hypothetical protein
VLEPATIAVQVIGVPTDGDAEIDDDKVTVISPKQGIQTINNAGVKLTRIGRRLTPELRG